MNQINAEGAVYYFFFCGHFVDFMKNYMTCAADIECSVVHGLSVICI